MRRGQEAARALALELGLVEDADPAGGARLVLCARLRGAPEPIGEVRRYVGPGPVVEVLSVRLAVAALGLEVERLLAFAAADLPLPHLSLSLTRSQPPGTPGLRTVIVDLIPRVDLAVNLGHAEAVFRPLADARAQALVAEGARELAPGPLRAAIGSPWAALLQLEGGDEGPIDGLVDAYVEHWRGLVRGGLGAPALAVLHAPAAAERDRRLRAALADRRVEPLIGEVERLCDRPQAAALAALIAGS
ncbi:MAG: hypothetical protein H6710_02550 [Myxococcales bacterium]|nr:hypothetical protein [Myxococcales bacterium]